MKLIFLLFIFSLGAFGYGGCGYTNPSGGGGAGGDFLADGSVDMENTISYDSAGNVGASVNVESTADAIAAPSYILQCSNKTAGTGNAGGLDVIMGDSLGGLDGKFRILSSDQTRWFELFQHSNGVMRIGSDGNNHWDLYNGANLFMRFSNTNDYIRVERPFAYSDVSVSLTSDNQVVSITRGQTIMSSNSITSTDRTFTLANPNIEGKTTVLLWNDTDAGELLDTGNACLSANWVPTDEDSLHLIYSNSLACWVEISRSAN